MAESKLLHGVEARLHALHATPSADGSDVGVIDTAICRATETALSASGFDELPEALYGAVCDLAAADCAEYFLSSEVEGGEAGTMSDCYFTVRYKDGTSRSERIFEAIGRMRADGMRAVNEYRRIRW